MRSHPKGGETGPARLLRTRISSSIFSLMLLLVGSGYAVAQGMAGASGGAGELRIEKVGAPEQQFFVVSTLIVGPTESILWDGQYRVSGGRRLAERIAETGTTLKAVVLSHADHDHYLGLMEVLRRFPGTPVYMTQSGLDDFHARSQHDHARELRGGPNPEVPDSLPEPQLLPPGPLRVDGHELVVIEGLVGDVRGPASAAIWIPSLRTVLAGDLVFEGIHPWLGASDIATRVAWRESLRRLAAFDPVAVVPGHKRDLTTPDSPAQIDFMIQYFDRYDAYMRAVSSADELVELMVDEYPDLALPGLMAYGARRWFQQ